MTLEDISLLRARALLEQTDRHVALMDTLFEVERTWQAKGLHGRVDSSAQAHLWNSLFYSTANANFVNDPGFQLAKSGDNQSFLVFDELLVVRFKKFDRKLGTSNYPTLTNRAWEYQLPLAGVPVLQRLNLGYQLDITGMLVEYAYLTLPRGPITEWVWQLHGDQIEIAIQTRLGWDGEPVFAYTPIQRAV